MQSTTIKPAEPQPKTYGYRSNVCYVITIRSERDTAIATARAAQAETRRVQAENGMLRQTIATLEATLKRKNRVRAGGRP